MNSAILVLMIVILVIGVPLGYMLGIVSLAGLAEMGGWPFLRIIATRFHSGVESFLLIAIPFFILAAMIMNASGLTDRLIRFVNLLIGHYPGGLSHVNIGGLDYIRRHDRRGRHRHGGNRQPADSRDET